MSNPIVIASMTTLDASPWTVFKARRFGTITYLADDDGFVHKCAKYKGKTYYLDAMPDVIGRPFDTLLGLLRDLLCLVGMAALALHLGLWYGGFYHYLAEKYPTNSVLRLIGGA